MNKTLFLLQFFLASTCFAEVNSSTSLAFCREAVKRIASCFSPARDCFNAIKDHLCLNEEIAVSSIEAVLTQWFLEEPELINYACYNYNVYPQPAQSYTDQFTIMVKVHSILLETPPSQTDAEYFARISGMLARSREVVRVLKQLGVRQTLSDKQVDIFAQQAAKALLEN